MSKQPASRLELVLATGHKLFSSAPVGSPHLEQRRQDLGVLLQQLPKLQEEIEKALEASQGEPTDVANGLLLNVYSWLVNAANSLTAHVGIPGARDSSASLPTVADYELLRVLYDDLVARMPKPAEPRSAAPRSQEGPEAVVALALQRLKEGLEPVVALALKKVKLRTDLSNQQKKALFVSLMPTLRNPDMDASQKTQAIEDAVRSFIAQ